MNSSATPPAEIPRHVGRPDPLFEGAGVPAHTLMEYLKTGDRRDDFLTDFPTISREQIGALLEVAVRQVLRVGG